MKLPRWVRGAASALAATLAVAFFAASASTSGCGGGTCTGDPEALTEVTAGPIACQSHADCCVVVNGCQAEAYVVSADDQERAREAMATCGPCLRCVPPAIQVGCVDGVCVGTRVGYEDAGADLMQDHCGVDAPSGFTPGKLRFTCGG